MELKLIELFEPILTAKTRYILAFGGRGRGGSTAGSQYIIYRALADSYCRGAVMREVLGTARSSIWQELKDRIDELDLESAKINDSNMILELANGNEISAKGFKKASLKDKAKLKSLASYNLIVIDEADEVTEEDFNQLDSSIRTDKGQNTIVLIFNMPDANHWIIKRWFNLVQSEVEEYYVAEAKQEKLDTTYIFGTYKDNLRFNSASNIALYESFKESNPDYYYSMIQGLVSAGKKGRIFKNFNYISESDYELLEYTPKYGLDFGFTNDPTALVEIKEHNNRIYIKELLYETGLTNQMIAQKLKIYGIQDKLVIADSSEPKSIEELRNQGCYVEGAIKGTDSVRNGIDKLISKEIYLVESSSNLINEFQNYCWALDRNKNPINTPIDDWNHIIDGIRYSLSRDNNLSQISDTYKPFNFFD